MSNCKKQIRANFRKETFARDKLTCQGCGRLMSKEELDAHHITPREEMPNGGYVKENGVTLCKYSYPDGPPLSCHEYAEAYLKPEEYKSKNELRLEQKGYSPTELYGKIGSSYEQAYKASKELGE